MLTHICLWEAPGEFLRPLNSWSSPGQDRRGSPAAIPIPPTAARHSAPPLQLCCSLPRNPSGFSVYANQLVFDDDPDGLERLARYLTRAPLGVDTVRTNHDGQVEVSTPAQPRTADTLLRLDPLDWIHAICQQIPDRGQHFTR